MAEKRFLKGLFKDTAHIDQPNGTWRYARNMILNEKDGAVSNEGGNELAGHLGDTDVVGAINDKVLGKIQVDNDRIVLFVLNISNTANPRSEIGIWENGEYTIIFNPNVASFGDQVDLKFKESHPIEGTFKIDGKGDLIVYWTDDLNPPRAMNVDRQLRANAITNNVSQLYGIDPVGSHKHHIDLLNLFPNSGPVPTIRMHDIYWVQYKYQNSVNTGGGLLTGVYYLALAYVDDDLVQTNYLTVSNPVSIVDEYDHTKPTSKKDGAKHGSQTSKAIKWRCENINTDYKYLQPVVIRKMGDATEAFKLNILELAPDVHGRQDVVFSGLEGFQSASVEDVIIDTISYETAKTINQLDGVLYLGNLTGTTDLGYQKYANNIKLRAKTKDFENFDTFYATLDNLQNGFKNGDVDQFDGSVQRSRPAQSYRYIPNIYRWKGYQRDEVYALYLAFIMNDGSMSYAYHIPGRAPIDEKKTIGIDGSGNDVEISETDKLSATGADLTNEGELFEDLEDLSRHYSRNFHFFEFSELPGSNNMNFWENATEYYPTTDDYQIWDENTYIDSQGNLLNVAGSLQGEHVRHHHFPSNENDDFKTVVEDKSLVDEDDVVHPGNLPPEGAFAAFITPSDPLTPGTESLPQKGQSQYYNEAPTRRCDNPDSKWQAIYVKSKHYNDTPITSPTAEQSAGYGLFDQYWSGTTFTADCEMEVEVCLHIPIFGGDSGSTNSLGRRYRAQENDHIGFLAELNTDSGTYNVVTGDNGQRDVELSNSCEVYNRAADSVWYSGKANANAPCGLMYVTGSAYYVAQFPNGTNNRFRRFKITMKAGDELKFRWKPNICQYAFNDCYNPYYLNPTSQTMGSWFHAGSSDCDPAPINGSVPTIPNWVLNHPAWTGPSEMKETEGFVFFNIVAKKGGVPPEYVADVKLNHHVRALGFTLDDIKIPKTIADKVQGFRIYYAKREFSDRRIIGQAPIIPMLPDKAKLGLCKEAWDYSGNTDSMRIMQTVSEEDVNILRKYPYGVWQALYPKAEVFYRGKYVDYHSYKYFTFPDFYLLRKKASLAGATHLKVQYIVDNFCWNGPGLTRDKKEISTIVEDDGGGNYNPPIKRIETEWGWERQLNCWGKEIRSAFFAGRIYRNMQNTNEGVSTYHIPRVLGQKAKSYIQGDSIFNAEALGFGHTIVNERGDSNLILGLKDMHELYALSNSLSSSSGATNGNNAYNAYGVWHENCSFLLVGDAVNGTHRARKQQTYLTNLHSFKTDVYKSIDDQELVWTGFEVVGEDIQNFVFFDKAYVDANPTVGGPSAGDPLVFEVEPTPGNPVTHTADYSIETLQTNIQTDVMGQQIADTQYHIFGGDTFICRYGFATGYTPLDSEAYQHSRRSLYSLIVESVDNINFRHLESLDSTYFPGTSAKEVLDTIGPTDLNHQDNIKYNDNYSSVNDIRPAFPLPVRESKQEDFPTRTHRSVVTDPSSLIDNYRLFKANQFKDLPKNRGDLWKLSTFNNLLYFHMEESLFAAKGKQTMSMGDGSEAFVGSGDIFKQDPDEIIHTKGGFGGTQSQYAALTTRFGYFFVDGKSRKIFLMKDKLLEISSTGMENWFRDNIKFELEDYGFGNCAIDNPIAGMGFHSVYDPKYKRIILTKREFIPTQKFKDNYLLEYNGSNGIAGCQTFIAGGRIQFNSKKCVYQEYVKDKNGVCKYRDLEMNCFASNYFECKGWTISYYPELGVWGSFHDYVPYIYFNTDTDFYSLTDIYNRPVWCTQNMINNNIGGCASTGAIPLNQWVGTTYGNAGIWRHNSESNKGIQYQENTEQVFTNEEWLTRVNHYPFEFEFIHNELKSTTTLLSSFNYTLETFNQQGISVLQHGFTQFFIYNTFQISGIGNDVFDINNVQQTDINGTNFTPDLLEYFINVRRVGNNWKVNRFRDLAALVDQTGTLNTANTSAYYTSTNTNIIGGTNTGTITNSSTDNMFIVDGMREIVNGAYIDLSKNWNLRRKFMDKWVGIRLIYDNISNNLLNLYSTEVVARKIHR